jgi:hypothetical protein
MDGAQGLKAQIFVRRNGPTKEAAEKLMFCIRARLWSGRK